MSETLRYVGTRGGTRSDTLAELRLRCRCAPSPPPTHAGVWSEGVPTRSPPLPRAAVRLAWPSCFFFNALRLCFKLLQDLSAGIFLRPARRTQSSPLASLARIRRVVPAPQRLPRPLRYTHSGQRDGSAQPRLTRSHVCRYRHGRDSFHSAQWHQRTARDAARLLRSSEGLPRRSRSGRRVRRPRQQS